MKKKHNLEATLELGQFLFLFTQIPRDALHFML